jgi:hypothetical protein
MKTHICSVAFALVLPFAAASAQPPAPPPPPVELTVSGSATGSGDTDYAGRQQGSVELRTVRFSASYRGVFSEVLSYRVGASFSQATIDASAGVPLPERLQAVHADLSATWAIDRHWSILAMVQPGHYGDTEASGRDAFAVPATLLAQWRGGGAWSFGIGARYNSLSRNPLMPAAYVRWEVAPDWTVSLGAPRTEVAWRYTKATTFFAGSSFEGGAFAVDDPAVKAPAGYPSLRETKLDYREIRVGAGVRQQLTPTLRLQAEAGAALGRQFEYFDRSLKIKADSAAYLALSLSASF